MQTEFCQMLQMIMCIFSISLTRVAFDRDYERIHKGREMHRAQFYSLFKGVKEPKGGEIHQQQNVVALSFYWIKKGLKGLLLCGCWAVRGVATQVFVGFAKASVCSNVIFCLQLWRGGS